MDQKAKVREGNFFHKLIYSHNSRAFATIYLCYRRNYSAVSVNGSEVIFIVQGVSGSKHEMKKRSKELLHIDDQLFLRVLLKNKVLMQLNE